MWRAQFTDQLVWTIVFGFLLCVSVSPYSFSGCVMHAVSNSFFIARTDHNKLVLINLLQEAKSIYILHISNFAIMVSSRNSNSCCQNFLLIRLALSFCYFLPLIAAVYLFLFSYQTVYWSQRIRIFHVDVNGVVKQRENDNDSFRIMDARHTTQQSSGRENDEQCFCMLYVLCMHFLPFFFLII